MAYTNFTNCTAEQYKNIVYNQETKNKIKILFNNVELEDADEYCESFEVQGRVIPTGSKSFMLNNLVSVEAELILHNIDTSIIQDQVSIYIGTVVGNNSLGDIYEYVPIGIFNLQEKPTTDAGKTTIKLRDNSVKLDFNYNAKPLIDLNGGSATKKQILDDICSQAGITSNVSSFLGDSDAVGIYDNTVKGRQYVCWIAEQAGALPIITRSGALDFVYINNLTTNTIPIDIVEKYENGDNFKISRVVYEDGIRKYEYGSETNDTLFLDTANPYISNQERIESIHSIANNFEINSFETGRILGNPAIDYYDLIQIHDKSKNLFDKDNVNFYANNSSNFSNTTDTNKTRVRTASFNIDDYGIETNTNYVVSGMPNGWSLLGVGTFTSPSATNTSASTTSGATFKITDNNIKYIYLLFGNNSSTSVASQSFRDGNIQIEKGNTPTSFEKYYDYLFTTFANYKLTYNGKLTNTFDSKISFERKQENVSLNSQQTFKRYAKTEIDNLNAEITIQAGQIEEIEQDIQNPTSTKEGTSIDITDALDSPLIDFKMYGDTQQDTAILPSEYQQVEYIESTSYTKNTNYIDLNFKPNNNTKIEVRTAFPTTDTQYSRMFGSSNLFKVETAASNQRNHHFYWNDTRKWVACTDALFHTYTFDQTGVYKDGVIKQTFDTATFQDTNNLRLFSSTVGDRDSLLQMSYAKLWNNGTLIRDMIPCYRKSDNVIGLYDLVNNVFYTNAGTGTFTKGSNVSIPNPDYPQPIEVVTGRQNIEVASLNLANIQDFTEKEYKDMTYSISNQVISLAGTSTGGINDAISTLSNTLLANQPYTIATIAEGTSNATGTNISILMGNATKSNIITCRAIPGNNTPGTNVVNYTPTQDTDLTKLSIYVSSSNLTCDMTIKVMLLKGTYTSATLPTYEAYTGYTQEIDLRTSTNIFNGKVEQGAINADTGKTYQECKTSNSTRIRTLDLIKLDTSKNYTISCKTGYEVVIQAFNSSKVLYIVTGTTNTWVSSKTFTNIPYIAIAIKKSNNSDITPSEVNDAEVMLEEGTSASAYTPYTAIELCKISTYQDKIYKTNDKWYLHKEIGKKTFDSNDTFTSNQYGTNSYNYAMGGYKRTTSEANVLCNVFRGVSYDNRATSGDNVCYLDCNLDFYQLTFRNTTYTSVTNFKNMMIGNSVYYVKLEPTEEEITNSELVEQLDNLMSNPLLKGLNHITNDTFNLYPNLFIEYFRDTSLNENFVSKEDMTKYYTKTETNAQILINSSSIQQSVSEVQETTNSNTGAITTLSNQVNTLQSSTNLRIDAINEQLEDGVSKVKTTTGYTFDSNGLSITKGQGFSSLTTDRYQKIEYNNKELSFMGFDDTLNKPISRIEELEARKITTGVHRTEKIQESGEYWTAQYYVGGGN